METPMYTPNRYRTQRGFSLMEILVAVAIFALIFIAALTIYDRSNREFRSGMERTDMQQSTRVAFEKIVAELRQAGFDYDRDGFPSGAGGAVW
jgi:prepilin-type N-terminal cleavage/methylation domain-containing protein